MARRLLAGLALAALAGCSSAPPRAKPPKRIPRPTLVAPRVDPAEAQLQAAISAYRKVPERKRSCPTWFGPPPLEAAPVAALRSRDRALDADPPQDPARFYAALYRACAARDDDDGRTLRAHLTRASEAATSPAAQELLARLLFELRWRLHPAPATFEALLEDRPRRGYWLGRLAFSARETHPKVRAAFEAAHADHPADPEAAFFVAVERVKAGAFDEALPLLERPDVAGVSPLGVRYWRGLAKDGAGDPAGGRADLLHLLDRASTSRRPGYFFSDRAHFPLGALAGLRLGDLRCVLMRSHQAEGTLEAGLQHGLHAIGTSCWEELPALFAKAKDDFHFLMTDGAKDYIEEAGLYVRLGYPQVAKRRLRRFRCEPGKRFPTPAQCRRAARLLADLERRHPTPRADPDRLFPGLEARLAAPRLVAVTEIERPAPAPAPPGAIAPPPGRRVIHQASGGDRAIAVSVAQTLDRTGEVSRGGYWLHVTDAHGRWGPPIYTGLRESFPYVVRSAPALPSRGDAVRVPVDIEEIDPASITFPPVGVRLKRKTEGLALALSLEQLRADTDGDGLTDLVEERMATDPERADTDRDGVHDAQDNLPLTPLDATPPTDADEVLTEVLARILARRPAKIQSSPDGAEVSLRAPRAVVFVQSARPSYAHTQHGGQLLVMPPEAYEAYGRKFGLTLPLRLGELIFSPDRTEALITYSFGWAGGTIWARRVDGRWVLTTTREWIT